VGAAAALVFLSSAGTAWALEPTTTTITSVTPEPSAVGEPFTVAFAVSSDADAGIPTGRVRVKTSSGNFCVERLANGSGKCILSTTTVGEVGVGAEYEGDEVFAGSASSARSHGLVAPLFSISGASVAHAGTPYVVNLWGLQPNASVDVTFGDGQSEHVEYSDGAPPDSISHLFQGGPGCYVVIATNQAAVSNPLGVDLVTDDGGVGTTCTPGVGSETVAQASTSTPDAAVSATLVRPVNGPLLTVVLAIYPNNPSPAGISAAMFADIAVRGATTGVTANVVFEYALPGPSFPALFLYDVLVGKWREVQAPVAIDSAGRLEVSFSDTTYPRVRDLDGTFFAVANAIADAGSERSASPSDAAPAPDSADGSDAIDTGSLPNDGSDAELLDASTETGDESDRSDAFSTDVTGDASTPDDVSARNDGAVRDAGPDSAVAAAANPAEDTGCGCRSTGHSRTSPFMFMAIAASLAAVLRRRTAPHRR
jgi:MYXO-CTERM domain-containing protein